MRANVDRPIGPARLLYAFEAVIIGGMGSFWGTLAGAWCSASTQQIGFRIDPGWGIWFGHIDVPRRAGGAGPQGLFPKTKG